MNRFYTIVLLCLSWQPDASAKVIKGIVTDNATAECLIGATVSIKECPSDATVTGLDGSFTIGTDIESPTLLCSYIGYAPSQVEWPFEIPVEIKMAESSTTLSEVVVNGRRSASSDNTARLIERQSMNVVNVLSGQAMELSPDVTVGNMLQRMSGVSVERNSSGEGAYAILRGMDKRYNYTLVNGIKIPSPDNKNRFVPLDLFPSEILDRIEVYKSPTSDLEGDGIGGAVNLVMKDAPDHRLFTADISTGYNALYFDRDFLSFSHGEIASKSPNEIKGTSGDYSVSSSDFTNNNLKVSSKRPLPDLLGGLCYGDRFFDKRLGIIASVSYQNIHRGKNSDWYYRSAYANYGIEHREYSEARQRLAIHSKTDYAINGSNRVSWYNGYLDMRNTQVRQAVNDKTSAVRLK